MKPQRSQRNPLGSQKELPLKETTQRIIYEAQVLTLLRALDKRVVGLKN